MALVPNNLARYCIYFFQSVFGLMLGLVRELLRPTENTNQPITGVQKEPFSAAALRIRPQPQPLRFSSCILLQELANWPIAIETSLRNWLKG